MTDWTSVLNRLIRNLMRRHRTSEAEAQDLIYEAWLRTFEYSSENEVHNKEAFIETTANNLATDHYRHAQRYPHEKEDIHTLDQRRQIVDPGRNPHEVYADDQRLNQIRDALNGLLKGMGDIFLAHRAGYSHKELAAAYGLSTSAIEKRIARAVLWLMEQKERG